MGWGSGRPWGTSGAGRDPGASGGREGPWEDEWAPGGVQGRVGVVRLRECVPGGCLLQLELQHQLLLLTHEEGFREMAPDQALVTCEARPGGEVVVLVKTPVPLPQP